MNFYFEAAKTLDRLDAKQGSIKGIIATLPEKDRKRSAALVIETLKFKAVLSEVISKADLLKEERKVSSVSLALVLVHDLLLARGIQAGDGPIKQAILRHKTRLHGEFQKLKIKKGATSNEQLANVGDERAANIPRYVRVNSCLTTVDEAVKHFASRGFSVGDPLSSKKAYAKDEHVPNLLLFSPSISFQDDPFYQSGKIILQDKASCFPALVLSPLAADESLVIDATAAPGNKTSHLSALMQNKGKLFAFEKDRKRFTTLKMMVAKAGCTNVRPINSDFLTVDPLDLQFAQVTHILLDPSCSGSGIVNRLDHLLEKEDEDDSSEDERLEKLAAFQLVMIKHAMRFPKVNRIVYSTCSVHAIENEGVIKNALNSDECRDGRFRLAPQNEVLPSWPRRGQLNVLDSPGDACSLVRCSPGEDATNGFFVSCFVKAAETSVSKRKAIAETVGSTPKRKKRKKSQKQGTTVGLT
ncbi:S-adenosyl-L-methionine-dependent methyltransferase [Crepidotus variabilis]|uniref:S-adenosyl-L-methionine-dependent methyltransferase n=1 Tax=Crepidotus variabilis TaxID=179855 RepID=A0A9P6JU44_9AGAR|nr:S-adenosyl-L-methionine-dependent methyltransferase [Crepidotus variabilis]